MTLKDWLEKENKTIYWLEHELGYAHGYLYQVKDGKKPITQRMSDKIFKLTNGEVKLL